jgi:phosphate transport system protein
MPKHLRRDLDNLKKEILATGALVEEATDKAIASLVDRRPELALEVIEADRLIDEKEVATEVECLKVLALHQPVARDLRFIIAVMKVNNDLERMGDLAVNIAERATFLAGQHPIEVPLDFTRMMDKVRQMLRESLDALVNQDTRLARKICADDDVVDAINHEMFEALQDLIRRQPETLRRAVHTLIASRHLERIADHATNIAEDVIFMVDGDVVRHRVEDYARYDEEDEVD